MQHTESARYTHGPSVTLTDGPLYISNHFSQEKASTVTIPTHIKILQTRKVVSTATATISTTAGVNTYIQTQVQTLVSRLSCIAQEKQCGKQETGKE